MYNRSSTKLNTDGCRRDRIVGGSRGIKFGRKPVPGRGANDDRRPASTMMARDGGVGKTAAVAVADGRQETGRRGDDVD